MSLTACARREDYVSCTAVLAPPGLARRSLGIRRHFGPPWGACMLLSVRASSPPFLVLLLRRIGTSPVALVRFCRPGPWIRPLANHSVGVWGCLRVPVRQRIWSSRHGSSRRPSPRAPLRKPVVGLFPTGAGRIGTAVCACRGDLG